MKKPLLRGYLHLLMFVFVLISVLFYFNNMRKRNNIAIIIYMLGQLLAFGISSIYHIYEWKSVTLKNVIQKLDHSAIFILIAATHTAIILLTFRRKILSLIVTWILAITGIFKTLYFTFDPVFNVFLYIFHGVSILPFFYNIDYYHYSFELFTLYIIGGLLYSIGGLIFACGYPNIHPDFFGYHELFHLLTILGNMCYFLPIMLIYFKDCGEERIINLNK